MKNVKGYKAFKKGMICDPTGKNPYQFAENTVFEQQEDAEICKSGFHFCKDPLAVMNYYPLVDDDGNMTEFAEVEALDECYTNDNEKYCTKKLKIGAKLDFAKLVQASVSLVFESIKESKVKTTSKDYAQIGSSGYSAKIGSSGDSAKIGSSGDSAQIGSSGNYAKINSEGKHSVICCAGHGGIVKAKKGSWITLAEWKYSNAEKAHIPVCVKTVQVDGEIIKEDTYYRLVKGEFVEVEE